MIPQVAAPPPTSSGTEPGGDVVAVQLGQRAGVSEVGRDHSSSSSRRRSRSK